MTTKIRRIREEFPIRLYSTIKGVKSQVYNTIYPYMVADTVSTGKTVFAVDKMERSVKTCNSMTVTDFFRLIHSAEVDKSKRYDFFTVDTFESEVEEDAD